MAWPLHASGEMRGRLSERAAVPGPVDGQRGRDAGGEQGRSPTSRTVTKNPHAGHQYGSFGAPLACSVILGCGIQNARICTLGGTRPLAATSAHADVSESAR